MMNRDVRYLTQPADYQEKEAAYLRARRLEGRVLSDDEVAQLPHLPFTFCRLPFAVCLSPFEQEWRWRRRSFQRLQKYLLKKHAQRPLRILDLGCGNGWMANRLAEQSNWDIWAVDLNNTELVQGVRCFGRTNLQFVYADVLAGVLPQIHFDVVVLAASVQYFPDLPALCAALRNTLRANGEIHVVDSHFYKNETARAAARQRTADYYARLGTPEMAAFYHHHLWADAAAAGAQNLNGGWPARLLQKAKWLAPFPWLLMEKSTFAAKKSMKTKKELQEEYKQKRFPMGVFQIRNVLNGKVFVESSLNLDAIWNRHRAQLGFGSHPSKALQQDWAAFGEENFRYEILSEIQPVEGDGLDYGKEVKVLERMYLEELQPFEERGYNQRPRG